MAFGEQITSFSVQMGHTNVVDWNYVIRLTLASGRQVTIMFPENPPADFVTFGTGFTNVWLAEKQFEQVWHLLQSEEPVFFGALDLFGLKTAMLSTNPEHLGSGFLNAETLPFVESRSS